MTVQRKGSTGDLSEALTHVREGASVQDLRLVVHDESQGDPEENLRTFVEKTVPDPQHRLASEGNQAEFGKKCTPITTRCGVASPQSGEFQRRGR